MTTTATRHRPSLTATSGPYARPPHCDNHKYQAGCAKCRRYQSWSARRQRLSVELAQPLSYGIDKVRGHILALQQAGMRIDEIAAAADMSCSTVSGIRYQANRRFVCRDNALRILAVSAPDREPGPRTPNLVPVVGTLRRMRALARLGWTFADIIAAGGSAIHRLDQVKDQEWVTERFAAAVKTAYEALSMRQGPSIYTAARAAKKGWPPPLAWDDEALDDPNAEPDLGDPNAEVIDEIAVRRALAGERVSLTRTERDRAIAIGLDRGMTAADIARALHISGSRALELVKRVRTTQAA
ncbi:hypothetical protein [Micromonospora sp. NPDC023633]|uniref:hypothetical protein n=1 Tax=Micromonospora sp. NPDC023633 TaxID=3154320 RepID=UPI0033E235D0